jgi:hypothetical protein
LGRFVELITAATLFAAIATAPVRCEAQETPRPAATADGEAYREPVRAALDAFAAKNWVEARRLFSVAHQLEPSARTLRGLGMVAFEMQDYVQARGLLRTALDDARKPLEGDLRGETEALLERTHGLLGRVSLHVVPAEARVLFDGAPVADADGEVWIAAGTHVITVEAAGHTRRTQTIGVAAGGRVELKVQLEPAQPLPAESDTARSQAVAASLVTDPYDRQRDAGDEAITEKWWFWAGASVLAVGIAASVIVLASGGDEERPGTKGTGGVVITTLSLP